MTKSTQEKNEIDTCIIIKINPLDYEAKCHNGETVEYITAFFFS
jgi:hypothetical protein